MKVLSSAKRRMSVTSGDSIRLSYLEPTPHGGFQETVVVTQPFTESHTFDEAIVVELDEGEFGASYGMGGFFLEHKD